jgi:hypothetical protein
MVRISVEGDMLAVEVLGWSRIWSVKRRLDIPLRCVRRIRADGELPRGFWIRWPGTYIPGVIKAGSYWNGSGWSFWDVRRGRDNVLVIELSGWQYDYLVVEVADAAATIERMRNALGGRAQDSIASFQH